MPDHVTVTYGSTTMGPGRPRRVVGISRTSAGPFEQEVRWRVLVTAADAADLAADCKALEDGMKTRFERLQVSFGSAGQWDFDPANDSGFNQVGEIEKIGEEVDGPNSRLYECSVTVALPAVDNDSRRESSIEIAHDGSQIETLTVNAVYTADSGTSAYETAKNKFPAYVDSIATGIGGTWDERIPVYEYDDQNKVCRARSVQRRLYYPQSGAGLNDPRLTNASIMFTRLQVSPGDTPGRGAVRLETVTGALTASVDVNQTTNLQTLYDTVIEPYLIAQCRALYSPRMIRKIEGNVEQNKSGNRIMARITLEIATGGTGVIAYSAVQTYNTPGGRLWVPRANGNQFSVHEYEIPINATRRTQVTTEYDSELPLDPVAGLGGLTGNVGTRERPPQVGDVSENWKVLGYEPRTFPARRGLGSLAFTTTVVTETILERYVEVEQESADNRPVTTRGEVPSGDAPAATQGGSA